MRICPSTSARKTVPAIERAVSAASSPCAQPLRTFGAHREVDCLDDIDEGLVLAILDIVSPPRRRSCRLNRDFGCLLALSRTASQQGERSEAVK